MTPEQFRQSSKLETLLFLQIKDKHLPTPEREYRFYNQRKWRFDFAWPDPAIMLAVEVEGGTRNKSRHTSGDGFHADCEKYNRAAIEGWRLLRFDSEMINDLTAIDLLVEVFG